MIGSTVVAAQWIALLSLTGLPGSKMHAGIAFGCADLTAAIFAGVICSIVKDTKALTGALIFAIVAQCVFYFICGGQTGGLLAVMSVYCYCVGLGASYCILYLLIQLRVPAEKVGSSLVVVITTAYTVSIAASVIAYLPQPVPFISTVVLSSIAVVTT